MTYRILTVLAVAAMLATSDLAAQQAAIAPRASVLFAATPSPAADPVTPRATYWKEGALLGGVPMGIAGYLLVSGLCDQDDSAGGGQHCGLKGLGGAVVGFLIGAVPGALIGGQIQK